MIKVIPAVLGVLLALGGCATASKDIAMADISPDAFATYNCEQLASETSRISSRVVQLGGRLDTASANDKGMVGVGVILFWPALFSLGGNQQQEMEYARLKGEYAAIGQVATRKQCPAVNFAAR